MILVVGGIKGGSGKTTIAINLAVIRARLSKKVLLIDADEQQSSRSWADQRLHKFGILNEHLIVFPMFGKEIFSALKKIANDFDDIIVDTGGRDTTSQRAALALSDAFLTPFRPRSLDIWTLVALRKLNSEIGQINKKLRVMSVLNQCDSRGADKETARIIIEENKIECLKAELGYRKSFGDSCSDGLSVVESKRPDKKAIEEIICLHDDIYI